MAKTLEEMASQGYEKLSRKEPLMKRNWEAMKDTMIKHYRDQPFGPTRKANYEEAIRKATIRFDKEKWKEKWLDAMRV